MRDVKKKFIKNETVVLDKDVEVPPETKKSFLVWVKVHKKQLILTGVSITTIVGIILGIKNKYAFAELWASLADNIKKVSVSKATAITVNQSYVSVPDASHPVRTYTTPTEAFDVSRHIRTMTADKHHSAAKAAEAAALGITLLPNQTLVKPYTKYVA